jgi:hypothetical protein
VSLALLEYFILIFVLEKATRHAEDCVVTKDIESGGKFLRPPGFWGQLQKSPLNRKKFTPSKAFETSD